uniref:Uncharacterized protein n=1 Tax=Photinus pyralis TaxID=7054 RepID=A0A1Y1N862_PHOPY
MDICVDNGDLEEEIQWGLNYRQEKSKIRTVALWPKKSPINLQAMWHKYQVTKQINELELLKRQTYSSGPPKSLRFGPVSKSLKRDRAGFTKKQYINYLATPHRYVSQPEPNPILALRKKLKPQKCSARLIELARPTKTRVYNTWNDYWHQLPAEVIERLDALLRTDHTLDPTYARCCFKELDRKKKKQKRALERKRKKKKKRGSNEKWLKDEIELTADLMVSFLEHDPLVTLSYKQTLISDVIVNQLVNQRHLKRKPMRNSANLGQRSIVDVVDQLSVWMDSVARYIDVQYVDSLEEIAPKDSFESMLYVGEGEGEGEDSWKRFKLPPLPPLPDFADLPSITKATLDQSEAGDTSEIEAYSLGGGESYDEGDKTAGEDETEIGKTEDFENLSAELLSILENSGVDFNEPIDQANLPGVTYRDVYEKIESLHNEEKREQKRAKQEVVENAIIEWAKASEPEKVGDRMIKKIRSKADVISECLGEERGKFGADGSAAERSAEKTSAGSDDTKTGSSALHQDKISLSMAGEESELSGANVPPLYGEKTSDTDNDLTSDFSEISDPQAWAGESKSYEDGGLSEKGVGMVDKKSSAASEKGPTLEIVPADQVVEIMGVKTDIPLVIPKHKPSKVFEHAPDTICCLTLKVWAVWLLEVASNAQTWSKWLSDIISEIRTTARILKGEVLDSNGQPIMFYQEDWKAFVKKVENMTVSWRQYSMHVKDLTDKIIQNFHGKRITCCPKCLEDNLIVNIAVAHDISQQLAEAMNTASYWRRWLDTVMMETQRLTSPSLAQSESDISNYGTYELIEIEMPRGAESTHSVYEIEELDPRR